MFMNHQNFLYLLPILIYISNELPKNLSNSNFTRGQHEAAAIRILEGSSPLKENDCIWYLLDCNPDKNSIDPLIAGGFLFDSLEDDLQKFSNDILTPEWCN